MLIDRQIYRKSGQSVWRRRKVSRVNDGDTAGAEVR